MLWLPGQRLDQWLESVEALIAVGPEHASLYLLEIYPNAPLRDEMARGGLVGGARRRCRGDVPAGAGATSTGPAMRSTRFRTWPGRPSVPPQPEVLAGRAGWGSVALHTRRGTVYDGAISPSTGEYVARVAAGESVRVDAGPVPPGAGGGGAVHGAAADRGRRSDAPSAWLMVWMFCDRYGAEL